MLVCVHACGHVYVCYRVRARADTVTPSILCADQAWISDGVYYCNVKVSFAHMQSAICTVTVLILS